MKDIPASPKLLRLDAQIKASKDPVERACLRAERAGYVARLGWVNEAKNDVLTLQREFGQAPVLEVSVSIQIVNAFIAHASESPAESKAFMQRANALSAAGKLRREQGLTAAWLAHFHYLLDDFAGMSRFLNSALITALESDHEAQSRLSLVIALSYHFSGVFELALPWYVRAREHANHDKDEPNLSAINFNMAARRSFYALQAAIAGQPNHDELSLARIGLESSHSFDELLGVEALRNWVFLLMATIYSASGKFQEAINLYDRYLDVGTQKGTFSHNRPIYLADSAWCRSNVRQLDVAAVHASEAAALAEAGLYVEDALSTFGRLFQYYERIGEIELAQRFNGKYQISLTELVSLQQELRRTLSAIPTLI